MQGDAEILPDRMNLEDVVELKYAPITFVDVERSFSLFKHVFSNRRQNVTAQNLSKTRDSICYMDN